MLALLKKTGSAEKVKESAWRIDFRDVASLPDTKTVRTNFIISAAVFSVLGALALFSAYREVALAGLRSDLAVVDGQISDAQKTNDKVLAEYKIFLAEEAKFKEAASLSSNPFRFGAFITHLASVFPIGAKANRIEFRGLESNIFVSGEVAGLDSQSSETASVMISKLQADEEFKQFFESIKLSNLTRNNASNSHNFELIFSFKKSTAAKGRK